MLELILNYFVNHKHMFYFLNDYITSTSSNYFLKKLYSIK